MTGTTHVNADDRDVLSNGSVMIVSRIISAALGWLGSVTMARTLSPTDWGVYSFIFALLGLLAVITDLGVGRAVLARITTDDPAANRAAAGSFIILRMLLGILGYGAAVAYAVASGQELRICLLIAFAGTIVVLSTPANALLVLYQSRLRLQFIAKWDIVGQIVQLAFIFLVAWLGPSISAFILASLVREVLVLAARWWGIRRGLLPDLTPSFRQPTLGWRETLIEAIPLSAGYALFLLLTKIDQLMLERMVGFTPVGIYAISYKFSDLLGLVITAIALPYTTVLVTSYVRKTELFVSRTRQALVGAATLGALAVACFLPTADGIIALLYGVEFESAGLSARMLMVAAGCSGISTIALAVLLAARKLAGFPVAALAALAAKITLNLWLIPRLGMNGAAVATVITEGALMFATLALAAVQLRLSGLIPVAAIVRLAVVSASIGYPLMLLNHLNRLHWLGAGFAAATLFFLYLWLTTAWPFDRIHPRDERPRHSASG